jgi:hypothetical protein
MGIPGGQIPRCPPSIPGVRGMRPGVLKRYDSCSKLGTSLKKMYGIPGGASVPPPQHSPADRQTVEVDIGLA